MRIEGYSKAGIIVEGREKERERGEGEKEREREGKGSVMRG